LDASGASVFLNLIHAAERALIHAASSTLTLDLQIGAFEGNEE
jgi:hypothetical protein